MSDNNKGLEALRGLFEGGSFPNAQINVLTGDNIHVSYEDAKKQKAEKYEGARQTVMDYVTKLMPVVMADYREQFLQIWKEILDEQAVSSIVYNRGRQQGTLFNRNLVAQITHMMVGSIIEQGTTDVRMTELLEPERGKRHPVRAALAEVPEDKQVKRAVQEVLEKHIVKVP